MRTDVEKTSFYSVILKVHAAKKTKQTHILILCKMMFCWLCMPLYARSLTMLESECDSRKCFAAVWLDQCSSHSYASKMMNTKK